MLGCGGREFLYLPPRVSIMLLASFFLPYLDLISNTSLFFVRFPIAAGHDRPSDWPSNFLSVFPIISRANLEKSW